MQREKARFHSKSILQNTMIIVGILIFPVDAFAWGPAAHIDFSMQILASCLTLAPSIARLLRRRQIDFLYGSLAADSILAKNMAGKTTHCHSWTVARGLFAAAKKEGEGFEAFMLGYIGHLAADVVAHNDFVPDRLVACYRDKTKGHLFWEAQFDQRILTERPEINAVWNDLAVIKFPEYDNFLAARLKPTLFSHKVSSSIYKQTLNFQRSALWPKTIGRIDSKTHVTLPTNSVEKWRSESVAIVALAIKEPTSETLDLLDPTGISVLKSANVQRRILRRMDERQTL